MVLRVGWGTVDILRVGDSSAPDDEDDEELVEVGIESELVLAPKVAEINLCGGRMLDGRRDDEAMGVRSDETRRESMPIVLPPRELVDALQGPSMMSLHTRGRVFRVLRFATTCPKVSASESDSSVISSEPRSLSLIDATRTEIWLS